MDREGERWVGRVWQCRAVPYALSICGVGIGIQGIESRCLIRNRVCPAERTCYLLTNTCTLTQSYQTRPPDTHDYKTPVTLRVQPRFPSRTRPSDPTLSAGAHPRQLRWPVRRLGFVYTGPEFRRWIRTTRGLSRGPAVSLPGHAVQVVYMLCCE